MRRMAMLATLLVVLGAGCAANSRACVAGSRAACGAAAQTKAGGRAPTTARTSAEAPGLPAWARPPARTVSLPASIDATGKRDVTFQVAAFLALVPDGTTVRFRPGGKYRMEHTIYLRYRNNLTLDGQGATVFARSRGDHDRSNFWFFGGSNIVVTHLTIRGANPHAGTDDAAYVPDVEGQHGLEVTGVHGFAAIGVTVTDTYGDFVSLGKGADKDMPWSGPVLIRDSTFARNGRQGITFVGARDVVVERSTFRDMRRATFDFEPVANSGQGADNVVIQDNHVTAGRLFFVAAYGVGPVNHITVQRNHLSQLTISVEVRPIDGVDRADWKVRDNTSDLPANNPQETTMRFYDVNGVHVHGNTQPMKQYGTMYGVRAIGCRDVTVSGNEFPHADAPVKLN